MAHSNRAPAGFKPGSGQSAHTNGTVNGHADPVEPVYAPDQPLATAVVRLIHNRAITAKTRKALAQAKHPEWSDLAAIVENSQGFSPEKRAGLVRTFLKGLEPRRDKGLVKAIRDALYLAMKAAEEDGIDDELDEPAGPPPFSLGLIDSATFFSQTYEVDWMIRGVTVKGEPSGIGGPSKALKTSILIDKAISIGTATPFLGKFEVPQPRRVALISGESGRRVIQSSARQVCLSRGLTAQDLSNIHWGFTLPQLTNAEHLRVLRKTIEDNGLEYMALDPFYLTLVAGSAGVDPKNMFEMGPLLLDVTLACLEAGCTPDIAHHFTKTRAEPFGVPVLADLAYAGFGQFLRQWMLVAPREKFDAEIGLFKLHFAYGGSAGHCGDFAVDIEVGKLEPDMDRRCWKVTIASPSEERAVQQQQRQAEQARKAAEKEQEKATKQAETERQDMGIAMEIIRKEPGQKITAGGLRGKAGWNDGRAKRALFLLTESGLIRSALIEIKIGSGAMRTFEGFEIGGLKGEEA